MLQGQPKAVRQSRYAVISIITGTIIGLLILEAGLRLYQHRVRQSEQMSPGFILYDDQLGWKLARNWDGRHSSHDYDVSYRTNDQGFRVSNRKRDAMYSCAVLGDSFTFGLGVNDDDTFVEVMNRESPAFRFINYAVPGYSTDQQWLLLDQNPRIRRHDCLLLVVYLANDLFDNLLPFPLQAGHAKPYIEKNQNEFLVRNHPVPLLTKPRQQLASDLARLNAPRSSNQSVARRLLHVSALGTLLIDYLVPETYLATEFDDHFDGEIEVFSHLLARIRDESSTGDVITVLLPGRSLVELPESYAGAVQEYFRIQLLRRAETNGVRVIDLAAALRSEYRTNHATLFYPNDGHLNVYGHVRSAAILMDYMKNLPPGKKIPD